MKKWTFTKFEQFQFEFFLSANYWLSGQNKKKGSIFTIKVLFLDPRQFSGPATIFRTRDFLPATRDNLPATRDPRNTRTSAWLSNL